MMCGNDAGKSRRHRRKAAARRVNGQRMQDTTEKWLVARTAAARTSTNTTAASGSSPCNASCWPSGRLLLAAKFRADSARVVASNHRHSFDNTIPRLRMHHVPVAACASAMRGESVDCAVPNTDCLSL